MMSGLPPSSENSSFIQIQEGTHHQSTQVKVVAGKYALQQKLGSGSFAVVYKGVRLADVRAEADVVAVKVIARSSEKLTRKVLQNLEIEISILRTYRHRNIVCLHDVQKSERNFYLVLEYCGGGDVQGLIRSRRLGRLSEGLTRRLMRDLSGGLRFLWGKELIHRDIKPQNLLLTGPLPADEMNDPEKTDQMEERRLQINFPSSEFVLKIADFGFARHLQSASLAETLCGSPLYMAPEILQHHRYDAKADLWSVGTVLFEMISGRPPFHGENHIDLLRNIQTKAVKLPSDVRVSKECVNLLRILLNRSPLSRAGFKEFFDACDAFVALGCQGEAFFDPGSCARPESLREIRQHEDVVSPVANSMITVSTAAPLQRPQHAISEQATPTLITPPFGPSPSPPSALTRIPEVLTRTVAPKYGLTPLVPSPPTSGGMPAILPEPLSLDENVEQEISNQQVHSQALELVQSNRRVEPSGASNITSDEGSFVMVEHASVHKSSPSPAVVSGVIDRYQLPGIRGRLDSSPPPTDVYPKANFLGSRGDYMVVEQAKGMLSTSPGTGAGLMELITGRARLIYDSTTGAKKVESQIAASAKLLATAEDVGRRAVCVAHVGDHRAYLAMQLTMMSESGSFLASGPMEGIEGVNREHDSTSAAVSDDSSSTELMNTTRRRSSSATDKSMADVKAEEEQEEMPFAVPTESPPFLTVMPSRESSSFGRGATITSSRAALKPSPGKIRSLLSEGFACYMKALQLLKGSVGAAQNVSKECETFSTQRLNDQQKDQVNNLNKRCEVTSRWLAEQFKGVLERGDAANAEVTKMSSPATYGGEGDENVLTATVEELIYNHALSYGKEGAVKQLLGQYDAARSCFRSAGLLLETLLMDSRVDQEDKATLESYVDGFSTRIMELDKAMLMHSRSGTGIHVVSSISTPMTLHSSSRSGTAPSRQTQVQGMDERRPSPSPSR